MAVDSLLRPPLKVVNVGLAGFAADLRARGVPVAEVDWAPPARGDAHLAGLLSKLSAVESVQAANREALGRFLKAEPVLVDVRPAGEVLTRLKDRMILHAGPPIGWDRMCGPLRGAIQGAIVLEGWAPDLAAAETLAASGRSEEHTSELQSH